MKYVWRRNYNPLRGTKHSEVNIRSFEALADFIARNGQQSQDALEAYVRRFLWHQQFSATVPSGGEFVQWRISRGNLVEAK